jgi:hypothetical protein
MTRTKAKPGSRRESAAPREAPFTFWRHEGTVLRALWNEAWDCRRWIIALFIVGAVLRFTNLTQPSLWMDEIVILEEAYSGKYKTVSYRAHAAHLAPVGFFLRTFGQNEFGLRFWGATLATLAVPLLFVWALWMVGRRPALHAAWLACVSCYLVYYAQDGNYYGGMTFYTALMLLGYGLLFRGAPHAGLALTVIAGYVGYRNHPIGAIPAGVMVGGMLLGTVLFAETRRLVYTPRVSEWAGRPVVAILGLLFLVFLPYGKGLLGSVAEQFTRMIEPGEGTLKNVKFGADLFIEHLTSFGVNFYRNGALDRWLAIVPGLLFLWGLVMLCVDYRREKRLSLLALAGLAIVLPLVSYFVLFSIQLSRNFYVRYFTYLVPVFLGVVGYGIARLQDLLMSKDPVAVLQSQPAVIRALAMIPVICLLIYTGRYLLDNKRNYKDGIEFLESQYREGDRFILLTRQDRIEANYYFKKAGLPTQSPVYTVLSPPGHANLMGAAFPHVMNGVGVEGEGIAGPRFWIVSAWRFVEAPSLYEYVWKYAEYSKIGRSRMGDENDLWIRGRSPRKNLVYPSTSARFVYPATQPPGAPGGAGNGSGTTRVVVEVGYTGTGRWRTSSSVEFSGASPTVLLESEGYQSRSATYKTPKGVPFVFKAIPILPDALHYTFEQAINWPEHQNLFLRDLNGTAYLRNERDGAYDYLVYQSEAETRHLVIQVVRRDEQDLLLQKNEKAIPPGMLVGVAVDGVHRGFWRVESGAPEVVKIPVELNLSPGNHRITVSGLQPRAVYTPYFPWGFVGIDWVKGPATEPKPSLEEQEAIRLAPGWDHVLEAGTPGERIRRDWTVQGPYETIVDSEWKCVAGDNAIRVTFPAKAKDVYTLLTPAMPVKPGMLATYSFHMKLEGLDDNEITPVHLFIGKDGKPIPGVMHANGPNHRGTTLGKKGWIRRQITVPVPDGAIYMLGGVRAYPVPDGNTTGGTLWLGSFFSPGAGALKLSDPILPDNYFGVSESTPVDEPAQ